VDVEQGGFKRQDQSELEEETTIEILMKKYPWGVPTAHVGRTAASSHNMEDMAFLFEGKNMRV
jgi:hypothetical protein